MASSSDPPSGRSGRVAIVVMGVSGAGKTTVGKRLAERLGVEFIDGDDLHSAAARAKMAAGRALDDADRWPWLDRIAAALADPAAPRGLSPVRPSGAPIAIGCGQGSGPARALFISRPTPI
jgi:adenylylsulfate kinase-like enzyme